MATPAAAITTFASSRLYLDQIFYAYVGAGETLDVSFTQTAAGGQPVTITVSSPTTAGAPCVVPAGAANGVTCAQTGLSSPTAGIWKIEFDASSTNQRYSYDIVVRDATSAVVTGRIWTDVYEQYQSGASGQSLWVVTPEGYLYGVQFINFYGIGSAFRANGFGLVDAGTCTPIYRSATGTSINANGVPLEAGIEYSQTCGDDYWLFFEAPDAALPAEAPSIDGTLWIRPSVVAPAVTDLGFVSSSSTTRAGDFTFDLAGVNGGYTVQVDANADGDHLDAVDRIIPWGSPPGAVSVPFDGLDGLGNPIGVCQPFTVEVVLDRAGEMHLVLEDVEQLGNNAHTAGGIRLTGLTSGILAPAPLLYWDDSVFPASAQNPPNPWPSADGTAGADSLAHATNGVHGWGSTGAWGDMRSIENWTYYQANAGSEVTVDPGCESSLTLDKQAVLDDTNTNGRADLGETIQYSFVVTNTGDWPLTDVTVEDPRVTGLTPAPVDLAVGADQTFTADPYVVTQADLDAGEVANTAVARGLDQTSDPVESPPDSEVVPTPDPAPSLAIDKRAVLNDEVTDDDLAQVGETVSYSFVVENTGNTTIAGVSIIDPRVTGVTPATVTLAPGRVQVFTADPYVVSLSDLIGGGVENVAHAAGTAPSGTIDSPSDDTHLPTLSIGMAVTGAVVVPTAVGGVILTVLGLFAVGFARRRRVSAANAALPVVVVNTAVQQARRDARRRPTD